MCKNCVFEPFPDRGRMCLDDGAFLANFSGCVQCRRKDSAKINNRLQSSSSENQEQVTLQHKCDNCGHVIADHEYFFRICGEYQVTKMSQLSNFTTTMQEQNLEWMKEYEMECLLCGSAEDAVSIMPYDPRRERDLY